MMKHLNKATQERTVVPSLRELLPAVGGGKVCGGSIVVVVACGRAPNMNDQPESKYRTRSGRSGCTIKGLASSAYLYQGGPTTPQNSAIS